MKKTIAIFSSSPIRSFAVGSFKFEDSILKFEEGQEASLEEFESVIADLPRSESRLVTRIDVKAAEAVVEAHKAKDGGATQVTDSTVGERQTKPKAEGNLNEDQAKQAAAEGATQETAKEPVSTEGAAAGGLKIGGAAAGGK